jgi:hypothetical protein
MKVIWRCIFLLIAAMTGVSSALAQDEIRKERISFERGTSLATVEGSITGYESVDYLVGAKAGQDISVTFETDHSSSYFNVIPPDEENVAVFIGSTSGNSYSGQLDLDGDWKIRVYLMRAAARRDETANYSLTVSVTGTPDASKARAVNDFGPSEWDARGGLGCAYDGQPMQTAGCPFKVVRYEYEEGATVFVVAPVGRGMRILYFLEGEWSTDSESTVDVTRRSDLSTVIVDNEAYEIPDAVIFGG